MNQSLSRPVFFSAWTVVGGWGVLPIGSWDVVGGMCSFFLYDLGAGLLCIVVCVSSGGFSRLAGQIVRGRGRGRCRGLVLLVVSVMQGQAEIVSSG